MTVSRLAHRPPAYSLQPRASTGLGTTNGPVVATRHWMREWSGDGLVRAEPRGEDRCTDHTGVSCPKFAEARAMQVLAELQLMEFNHRLANVLQRLVHRIERQRRTQGGSAGSDELGRIVANVQASARLHRYLLPPRTQTRVDLGALLVNVGSAIEGVTGLRCDVEAEPVSMPGPDAVRLAAAVSELAWNAHKHAYSGVEGGRLRIVCRRDTDRRLRLSVADQGCGLPADFDPSASEGLGLMVVCATARQFDGVLQAESQEGATVTLLLAIPDA